MPAGSYVQVELALLRRSLFLSISALETFEDMLDWNDNYALIQTGLQVQLS